MWQQKPMNEQDELFCILNNFWPLIQPFCTVQLFFFFFFLEEAFNGPCLHSSGCSKVVGLLSSVSRCREIAEVITKEIPWPQWQYLYDELLLCHLPILPHKPSNTILHLSQSLLWRCVFAHWTHPWTGLLEATFLQREMSNDRILWLNLEKRRKKAKRKSHIYKQMKNATKTLEIPGSRHMWEGWVCFKQKHIHINRNIHKRFSQKRRIKLFNIFLVQKKGIWKYIDTIV